MSAKSSIISTQASDNGASFLQQEAESYSFIKDLQMHSYLDVQDTASAWCLAEVTEIHRNIVRVHYDGWSEKYDEVTRA